MVSMRAYAQLHIRSCRLAALACPSFEDLRPSEAAGARRGRRIGGKGYYGEQ